MYHRNQPAERQTSIDVTLDETRLKLCIDYDVIA